MTATLVRPAPGVTRRRARAVRGRAVRARAGARLHARARSPGRAREPAGPGRARGLPAQPLASPTASPDTWWDEQRAAAERARAPRASARCSGRRRSSRPSPAPTPTPTSSGDGLPAPAVAGAARVARAAEPHRDVPDGHEPRRARRHGRRSRRPRGSRPGPAAAPAWCSSARCRWRTRPAPTTPARWPARTMPTCPGSTRLVGDVHRHGAAIAAQLVHDGANSLLDIAEGRPLLVPSRKRPPAPGRAVRHGHRRGDWPG